MAANFVFDKYGINKKRMKIINDKQVKCLKGCKDSYSQGCEGSSIRIKYRLPISVRGNNKYNIKSVIWEITHSVTHSFPNGNYFIGVVSNRNKNFNNTAYKGLIDAYGISGCDGYVYKQGKCVHDSNDESGFDGYPQNSTVKVEYKIDESKLFFTYKYGNISGNGIRLYEITLPTNNNNITHWYPCVSLRDKNDICKILNVIVK
eukprot:278649_1